MGLLDWLRRPRPRPISDDLWRSTVAGLPFLAALAVDEQKKLKTLAEGFLAEKEFSAAGGLELSDAICVSIRPATPLISWLRRPPTSSMRSPIRVGAMYCS